MEESYLPWWLILLIGMCVAAFSAWQHPSVHREFRVWTGGATWVYLVLIFVALGTGLTNSGDVVIFQDLLQATFALNIAIGLAALVWMHGRFSDQSQSVSYAVFTLTTAGICLLLSCPWIAAGLILVAVLSAQPISRELLLVWRRRIPGDCRRWWANLVRFNQPPEVSRTTDAFWLAAILSSLLACGLIGTLAYSVRVETTRANHSPRLSALPSRESLSRWKRRDSSALSESFRTEVSFESRADLIVLLAAVVFLRLAMSLGEHSGVKAMPGVTDPETSSTV